MSCDLQTGGLGHLGRPGDVTAEAAVDTGDSVGSGGRSSTYTHKGRGDEAGTRGMSATHQWAWGGMPE